MKNTIYLLALFLFSFCGTQAQLTSSNKEEIATLLVERINKHRIQKGHLPLTRHNDLKKAAAKQTAYLVELGILSHIHSNPDFKTVKKRVSFYNNSFAVFGENIISTKPITFPLNKASIAKIALDMFNRWKKSPGHYKNMISDAYTFGDISFDVDPKTRILYGAHVFGKLKYSVPNQLSDNAFGILSTDDYCNSLLDGNRNVIANMGNAVSIEGDEIIFRYHNKEFIKKVLEDPRDGIAIDLVTRKQMLCGEENTLDTSEIYDGVLLKPIYRDDFFANNMAEGDYRLVVSLGKVPDHLKNEELSPNLVLIKLGMKCSYVVPATVPSGEYSLKPVKPTLFIPKTPLKYKGIKNVTEVLFEFETGKSNASFNPELPNVDKLYRIDIQSFTSVDGNSSANKELHFKRANYIKDYINSKISISNASLHIDAKENWDLCDYQLERFGLDSIRKLSKPQIRNFIAKDSKQRWQYALNEQRRSSAILYQKGTWTKEDEQHLYFNLINGLISSNTNLTNKALVEIYRDTTNVYHLEENFILDRLFDKKELVQNVAALMLKDINLYTLDNVVFFVRNWLSKSDLLSKDAQKNLLNLYTITSRRMLYTWDLSAFNLSKLMHPEKVEFLFDSYKSEDVVNPLFLNFHMTRIRYYGQINEYEKTNESFNFITKYFKEQALTIDDDIALSLFFNSWSAYYNTTALLQQSYLSNNLNERSAFIFAKTIMAYPYFENGNRIDDAILLSIHEETLSFNKTRWCEWINLDFQNLRIDELKTLYCKECNN